ncbi:T9SS type A sorting domain-containing protein [Winogradskyella tangerina]|uniref:T9SS type A sorting domain-containing protein n=1 Tax=Winogradskyella tangerina TaxID=2023240 RepID=UPI000DBE6CD2|nr:spondin domain-containing protein [Winogradskyella tangerina]
MKKTTLLFLFLLFAFQMNVVWAQSTATYDITFTSSWNSSDHGTLPVDAHWSDLVGANHNSNVTFWELGETASAGIELVAESGINSPFDTEVQSAVNAGNAEQWLRQVFSPFAAISSATLSDVVVSEEYPLLTLVSMIAPSPDWMIGVNSLNLWDTTTNTWKDTFTIDMFPHDAGTEDGYAYSTTNPETIPRGVITNISNAMGYPFNSEKVGTLTVTLKSTTLSIDDKESIKSIKLFPNPNSTGTLTISNAEQLSEISLYDVLGKRVKFVKFSDNGETKKVIDLADLKDGIYIARMTSLSGAVESKKLVVNR